MDVGSVSQVPPVLAIPSRAVLVSAEGRDSGTHRPHGSHSFVAALEYRGRPPPPPCHLT